MTATKRRRAIATNALSRSLGLLAPALALLAEGSWIAVLYAAPTAGRAPMLLGPPAFAGVAAVGLLAAIFVSGRFGRLWPVVALALAAAIGASGWILAAPAREALGQADPGRALSMHVGGWLLGLAFLRGLAQAKARGDEAPTGSLLAVGIPAVVVSFVFAGVLPAATRAQFYAEALPDTVLFIGAGMVGLALVRMHNLDAVGGVDWRRNPVWFGALFALVAAMLAVAVPASFVVGRLILLLVALVPATLVIASIFSGIDRRNLRTLVTLVTLGIVAIVIVRILYGGSSNAKEPPSAGGPLGTESTDRTWIVVGWVLLAAVIGVVVAALTAAWMRRRDVTGQVEESGEERFIDRSEEGASWMPTFFRVSRPHRTAAPRDAVEAYIAALRELAQSGELRRLQGETPAEHSTRVRDRLRRERARHPESAPARTAIPLALGRLAADYELARFGAREITSNENRRAIRRWESVRSESRALRRDWQARERSDG